MDKCTSLFFPAISSNE